MASNFKHFLEGPLTGKILIATPQMRDMRFSHAVILVCGHDDHGAMGIVINKYMDNFTLEELFMQLDIPVNFHIDDEPVHYGGPIEIGRGFVVHTNDVMNNASVLVSDNIAISATIDILSMMAQDDGPKGRLCALGYAGWGAGQLENEIIENSWLIATADESILFNVPVEDRWMIAMNSIGVKPDSLSSEFGHA
jgi:putative transcriptional regulator